MTTASDTSAQRWLEKMPKRISSAAMQLENSAGEVLIVKAHYKNYWTFPGGLIDPSETPKEAAIRETHEEVGIEVDPELVEFVAVANRQSKLTQTYQFIFKAPLEVGFIDKIILQPSEIIEYALVTKEEVKTGNRNYGKIIYHWVDGRTGYIEQTFNINK